MKMEVMCCSETPIKFLMDYNIIFQEIELSMRSAVEVPPTDDP
jgi:hypothetical protein